MEWYRHSLFLSHASIRQTAHRQSLWRRLIQKKVEGKGIAREWQCKGSYRPSVHFISNSLMLFLLFGVIIPISYLLNPTFVCVVSVCMGLVQQLVLPPAVQIMHVRLIVNSNLSMNVRANSCFVCKTGDFSTLRYLGLAAAFFFLVTSWFEILGSAENTLSWISAGWLRFQNPSQRLFRI